MSRPLLIALLATLSSSAHAQNLRPPPEANPAKTPAKAAEPTAAELASVAPKIEFLKNAATPLRSIDPIDTNFSDLEAFGQNLEGVRIVAMGDPSYGDGAAFIAKHRLIRYLHEVKGFDVIAFESGFFDCRVADALFAGELSGTIIASQAVYPIWAQSEQFIPLFDYIKERRAAGHSLTITGIDCQLLPPNIDPLIDSIEERLDRADKSILGETRPSPMLEALRSLVTWSAEKTPGGTPEELSAARAEATKLHTTVMGARESMLKVMSNAEFEIVKRDIVNVIAFDADRRRKPSGLPTDRNGRDRLMADNFTFLANQVFADRKIFLWAGSGRLVRNADQVLSGAGAKVFEGARTTGDQLAEDFGPAYFVMLPIARQGNAGTPFGGGRPLGTATFGSLEDLMQRAGFSNAIITLRSMPPGGEWLDSTLVGAIGYSPSTGPWAKVADAFLFIDTMTPSGRKPRPRTDVADPSQLVIPK